jgi:hypothetical protein
MLIEGEFARNLSILQAVGVQSKRRIGKGSGFTPLPIVVVVAVCRCQLPIATPLPRLSDRLVDRFVYLFEYFARARYVHPFTAGEISAVSLKK